MKDARYAVMKVDQTLEPISMTPDKVVFEGILLFEEGQDGTILFFKNRDAAGELLADAIKEQTDPMTGGVEGNFRARITIEKIL